MSNVNPLKKLPGLLATVLSLTMASSAAMAAGTLSGTTVSNSATVNYNVGAIPQPSVTSISVDFLVDTKIDLTVATIDGAAVASTPGSVNNVLTFTVTNDGNASQDFSLSAVALANGIGNAAFGGDDNINADTFSARVESGGLTGYQSGSDTATHIDALAPDGEITVYIVSNFNTGYTNGDIASYYLLAEALSDDGLVGTPGGALSETIVADTPGSVDIVFIDGDGDGAGTSDIDRDAQHSSQNDYIISTAALTISKDSIVISDPVNDTTLPKRIPGAVIEYQITISNGSGAATATNIVITDSLDTEIGGGNIIFNTAYNVTADQGISIQHPGSTVPADYYEYSNAGGAEAAGRGAVIADWNVSGTNTVTVTGIALNADESAVIRFRVTIAL